MVTENTTMGLVQPMLSKFLAYADGLEQEAPHEISTTHLPSQWPTEGKIEIRNYSMQYRPELGMSLKDITVCIRGREKVGVVGRTGAGKSSLIYSLLRIVEPASGTITIDGIDTSTIGLHQLRSCISIVPQDPVLFEGTIRENLDPECKYTDKQIWKAIQTVQIEDILNAPSGTYTPVDNIASKADFIDKAGPWVAGVGLSKWVEPDGRNFSVGQRQLVCLCRAVLWHRRILILDEATANIDSKTDQLMQSIIRSEFKDCTVITIAHRLNTIMDSDRILVLDHGKAVEFDTPEALVKQGGHYAKLIKNTELDS
ncbi:Multidrug resistance-associated protein 1 [Coemansia guatemalensis]|uniref:Multidrug resistance-associated protein 1 n=1 Tax=Coemansia guatemalensis TaxID=2761395 RepID=A0A9W8HUJ4_9FUNG|nr:Multidrug resistance-associated protein 1 [Coemansia guatemalensis]